MYDLEYKPDESFLFVIDVNLVKMNSKKYYNRLLLIVVVTIFIFL